jgi:hypothetical protein
VHGVPGEPCGQPPEPPARSPGVAADEDRLDYGSCAVEAGELEVVDLAAVLAVAASARFASELEGELWPQPLATTASTRASTTLGGCGRMAIARSTACRAG